MSAENRGNRAHDLPEGWQSCTLEEVVNTVLRVRHMQSVQTMLERLSQEGYEVIKRTK